MKTSKKATAIICLSPNNGGMEIDAIKLSKKLSLYMQVILIAQKDKFIESQKNDYLNFNDIKLETIRFKYNFGLAIILNARRIIKKYGIKNVIFFGASELKSLYFSFFGLDINLIVRHGTTKSRPKKDWLHKLIYSNVNYHVSICKHLENNVSYIIPFGKTAKSKLIYSSFKFQEPKYLTQDKLTLLHIGRVADGKGQIDAIKACEILIENNIDFEFNLLGDFDASYKNKFMAFFKTCRYKDKIKLIGFTKDIESYTSKSDIFLFPSYGEGLSNAFLEAMSNNLICLAYNNTSFPELKNLGLYFKLVENKDINDLKNQLLYVANNLKIEKEKSNINNALIRKLFSLNKEMDSYLEILK